MSGFGSEYWYADDMTALQQQSTYVINVNGKTTSDLQQGRRAGKIFGGSPNLLFPSTPLPSNPSLLFSPLPSPLLYKKGTGRYSSSSEPHLKSYGMSLHLPYGITQCYLPPNTSERAQPLLYPIHCTQTILCPRSLIYTDGDLKLIS